MSTELPSNPVVGSTDLLADLEARMNIAWAEYKNACEQATARRVAIDAIVKAAAANWSEIYVEYRRCKWANAELTDRRANKP